MNIEECILLVEGLTDVIGSGEEEAIEKATADILQAKTFLLTVQQKIDDLNKDIELLNKRANGLRSANNDLIRQIGSKEENTDEPEEPTTTDEINAII